MNPECYYTQKRCKCGKEITINYDFEKPKKGPNALGWSIRIADAFDGFKSNGHFRSGENWPNWVYCNYCGRRHDLTKFKAIEHQR